LNTQSFLHTFAAMNSLCFCSVFVILSSKPLHPILIDYVPIKVDESNTLHRLFSTSLLFSYLKIFFYLNPRPGCVLKGKVKGVPLQAWSGPEGSRKLRFPDYMTTAQDGGKVVSPTHRPPLPPGNAPGTHFC